MSSPPEYISPLACIEMNSTVYDILKLKKAIKFKKYFDQQRVCSLFWNTFFSPVIRLT